MSYRAWSLWNEKNELRCLIIFRRLQAANFPRGMQMDLCREMSRVTGLDPRSISAKVCNFKSLAGVNRASNASRNTVEIHQRYRFWLLRELEQELGR